MRTTFSKNRPEGIPDLQAFLRTYTNYMQINNKVCIKVVLPTNE